MRWCSFITRVNCPSNRPTRKYLFEIGLRAIFMFGPMTKPALAPPKNDIVGHPIQRDADCCWPCLSSVLGRLPGLVEATPNVIKETPASARISSGTLPFQLNVSSYTTMGEWKLEKLSDGAPTCDPICGLSDLPSFRTDHLCLSQRKRMHRSHTPDHIQELAALQYIHP